MNKTILLMLSFVLILQSCAAKKHNQDYYQTQLMKESYEQEKATRWAKGKLAWEDERTQRRLKNIKNMPLELSIMTLLIGLYPIDSNDKESVSMKNSMLYIMGVSMLLSIPMAIGAKKAEKKLNEKYKTGY